MKNHITNRRMFLGRGLGLIGAAVIANALPETLWAQVPSSGVKPSGRNDGSMIIERKRFTWPSGKSLAVWIAPNVEVFDFDASAGVLNYSTQDYGIRVGLWRVADVL